MNTFKGKTQKMSIEEVAKSISCINSLGAITDEELGKRGLKVEEPQQINHFLNAIEEGQSNLLPEQAVTLLRLTPLLLEKGSTTVHRTLLTAAPKVIEAHAKAEKMEEKVRLAKVLKTAGLVCVDKRLKTAGLAIDRRLYEMEMFKPFIEGRSEYQDAMTRFHAAHKVVGFTGAWGSLAEAAHVATFNNGQSYNRLGSREYE